MAAAVKSAVSRLSRRRLATHAPDPPTTVPIVEFGAFLSGSPLHRGAVARRVVEAFKQVGFVYLAQTGVGEGQEGKRIFEMSKRFFDMPPEVKASLAWETPESNRGYVAQGRERVTQATDPDEILRLRNESPDFKETFELGRDFNTDYRNMWPSESDCSGFKDTMIDFFTRCHTLHLEVMRSIALGMGIGESYFDKLVDDQSHNLRLLNYPPVARELIEKSGSRAGSHTDYGACTLLFQDQVGGLEVEDAASGQFEPVNPIPDTVVVNIGDLLSRWSNNTLRSTKHRVVAPPVPTESRANLLPRPLDVSPARQSLAFFGNFRWDAELDCLPGTGKPLYPRIKAGDYIVRRLSETYV